VLLCGPLGVLIAWLSWWLGVTVELWFVLEIDSAQAGLKLSPSCHRLKHSQPDMCSSPPPQAGKAKMLLLTCIPHHMLFWRYVTQAASKSNNTTNHLQGKPTFQTWCISPAIKPFFGVYTRAQQGHGIKDNKPTACICQQLKVAAAHINRC
jgi:hypothetical protein